MNAPAHYRKVTLLAANIAHLTCRAQSFDVALAAVLVELNRLARRPAYREKVALACLMLARHLYGAEHIPSLEQSLQTYIPQGGEGAP
jgi:hypothetical protein